MGAVLDLELGQVIFNKLGVILNQEVSSKGHYVIDLILTQENGSVSGKYLQP